MKLDYIFTQLCVGEFDQLNLADADGGTIAEKHRRRVTAHINMGLLDLHKRFNLKEGHATLALQPGVATYTLGQPDLLKLERVTTPDGQELVLNDPGHPGSATTPSYNQLRLPAGVVSQGHPTLELTYRCAPAPLPMTAEAMAVPESVEVDLPMSHLQALLLFCASRVHNPLGLVNEANLGNLFLARYEAECRLLKGEGLEVDQLAQAAGSRFASKGFV